MVPFRPEDETRGILTAIVDASDDAIISEDLDGVIRSWNRAAERLYGYTAQEVTGRPMSLILPDDRREELATILDRIRAGERLEHYGRFDRRRTGTSSRCP